MHSFFAIATLVALLPAVFGAPTVELKAVQKATGPKKANSYIVTLKKGASRTPIVQKLKGHKTVYDKDFFNGFAAELTADELNELRAEGSIETIEEDAIFSINSAVTQTNAPWGLQRISQAGVVGGSASALTFTYKYDSSGGAGVDVYVVDTGILTTHSQFGGRARWGATFGGYASQDGNGHGTHCAGTIGGSQFGVSKAVNLVAVKVLSDAGSGAISDIVSGLNWVLTQSKSTGRPSIVSMSLGGGATSTLDNAVASLTSGGVHVVVAAGNDGADAANTSPARAPSAITVAASDINDNFASFSNYGSVVDIIAPGVDVISAYKGSNTAAASLSGTSMATPHVAGLVAYLIGKNGNGTPAAITSSLISLSVSGAIKGVPSGTVNRVANNEF